MKLSKPVKLKVVLDTSVCVAALLSKEGGSAKIFNSIVNGKIYNFYTEETLREITQVLKRTKFKLEKEKQEHFIHLLTESSFLIKPLKEFKVAKCRDPKDDPFLSLSNQVEADYLITLDKDLLTVRSFTPKIVTPKTFLTPNKF